MLGVLSAERELKVLKQIYDAENGVIPDVQIKTVVTMDMRARVGFGTHIDIMNLIIYDLMKYGLVDCKFDAFNNVYFLTDKGIRVVEENM